ncbi:YkuS family protein [Clostridium sp. JN-9]|uniref:YkuS family protein n=1 Tax=Clostridium sp. JN-9 TaxID=2507159 RepID=UPI000FFDF806|nr:YkuS family protein [Clostridium sp. JN-9]QAT39753.1 YkuS family protein [Clostridium sp. JN-9]
MKKIGVEKGLSMIADYLRSNGYSVETLGETLENNISKYENLDAIVTADYNTNMMGFSDTSTKVPVINASGLTAEEVKKSIDNKITKA